MSPRLPSLSDKETVVLELLSRDGEMYGLELVSASEGALKRGTVYVTLGRMEEKGYVTARQEEPPVGSGGMPRRIYSPTPLGRELLRTWTTVGKRLAARFAR
jgi:PadR family transcriptional regulator, regulatory protein PadR